MYDKKYIILKAKKDVKDYPSVVIIFSSAIIHRKIAWNIQDVMCIIDDGEFMMPTSAGFTDKGANDKWFTSGYSETLKVGSNKGDSAILNDDREYIEFGEKYSVLIKGLPPSAVAHINERGYFKDERIRRLLN